MGADLTRRRHLFFDLDDTLWDFESNSLVVLKALFDELALAARLNTGFDRFLGVYRQINQELWNQYYRGEADKQHVRDQRFRFTFQHFGYDDEALYLQASQRYLDRAPHGRVLIPGCMEVLDYLSRSYALHLITNGFREVQSIKLDGCGLRPYFSQVIISEEHGMVKPDLRLFQLAEKLAGAESTSCVMIGDNMDCDIRGAVNAGWEAIHFTPGGSTHTGKQIRELKELMQMF